MNDEATALAGEDVRPKVKTIQAQSLIRKNVGSVDAPAVMALGVKRGERVKINLANGIGYEGRITDILDGSAIFADGLTRSEPE